MRHDPASICPINECPFLACVCGGYLDVSYFPLGETLHVGHCPASAAEGPVLNVSWVRIPNYFLRSRLDL